MKNKIAAITTLSLILLIGLSNNRNFTNANAYISEPTNYHYRYTASTPGVTGNWLVGTRGASGTGSTTNASDIPTYTRVSDVVEHKFNSYDLRKSRGLDVVPWPFLTTVEFRFSNTSLWGSYGGLGVDYYPITSSLDSSSTSTSTGAGPRFTIYLDNTTDEDYVLYLDMSGNASNRSFSTLYNGNLYTLNIGTSLNTPSRNELISFLLPAGYNLLLTSAITISRTTIDAIYLQRLGVNPSYQIGYDTGFDNGYESGDRYGYAQGFVDGQDSAESNISFRISDLLSRVFGGVRNVFSIKIFDDLTIGSVLLFPIAFTIFTFIFRLIRGGKA
jgi:hypothetical protein